MQYNTIDTKDFYTSAIFWQALKNQALQVRNIQEALNDRLALKDYGDGLKAIAFVPIAQLPDIQNHPEELKFSKKDKTLTMRLKLDYDSVAEASETRFLQLTAQLFLRGLHEAPQEKITDFDWAQFQQDAVQVFMEKGWVNVAEA